MPDLIFTEDPETGKVTSVKLYGDELLAPRGADRELYVNRVPLDLRPDPGSQNPEAGTRLRGERWVNHFTGWELVVNRHIGHREGLQFNCSAIRYAVRRQICDYSTLPCPGPGGPAIEAPLHIDDLGVLNWDWKFWGDRTRMIFPSTHSQGPSDEYGHIGYDHDRPAVVKKYLGNVWRRTYIGSMVFHGGLWYDCESGHWIAITCRRPHVAYCLNKDDAGDGLGYDFKLHAPFNLGDNLRLPEIKIYYGKTTEEMCRWMGWYATFYYEEMPAWTHRRLWMEGLAWNNQPTWRAQADAWEAEYRKGLFNGVSINLVTNRHVSCGTLPTGYEPDPNHGTLAEFKEMCLRMRALDVPLVVWLSNSGVVPGAPDIDDDWFIRGVDGRMCAGWGTEDGGMYMCNPGHPGYIAYTKKWIRFYVKECGVKGIFFDCLGWVFPPDFKKRDFMRFPADTNVMQVRFQTEIYNYIKELDPEAFMWGEGVSLDAPSNMFSMDGNPVRAIDNMGPRDWCLWINQYAPKRITVSGAMGFPGSGWWSVDRGHYSAEESNFLRELAAKDLPVEFIGADQSVVGGEFFFCAKHGSPPPATAFFPARDFTSLSPRYDKVRKLEGMFGLPGVERGPDGVFRGLKPGVYKMVSQ